MSQALSGVVVEPIRTINALYTEAVLRFIETSGAHGMILHIARGAGVSEEMGSALWT
jgi:hypothetical protein